MNAIYGTFYDGKKSERKSGVLRVDSAGIVHIDGTAFEPCSYQEIKIPPRVGNVPRLIELPHDARFETDNNAAVDTLSKSLFQPHSLFVPHNWESKLRYIAASVLIVLVVLIGFIQYGIPFASKSIAYRLPPEYATILSEKSLDQLDRLHLDRSELNSVRKNDIRKVFEAHQLEADGLRFALHFRRSPTLGANAFALPDGSIIITDELIALAQTDEEILSILFHEMGHIVHRHALRRALESAGLYAVYSWMTGDLETLSSVFFAIPAIVMGAKYSRNHEWEADTYALERMTERRLDPLHFANIMLRLEQAQKEREQTKNDAKVPAEKTPDSEDARVGNSKDKAKTSGILDFISSHPPTNERIARFKDASTQLQSERAKE